MTEETPTSVPTPATPDSPSRLDSVQYVGFWRRIGAFALDVLVLGIVGQLLGLLFAHQFMSLGQTGRLLGFAIAAIYFIPAHHLCGRTLGKRLLRIRVQALNGGQVSLSAATVRYLALYVPWLLNGLFFEGSNWPKALMMAAGVVLASVLFIGILGNAYLLVCNRPSRRLIHDVLAGTVVVSESSDRIAVDGNAARLAPTHWVIIGLIPVAILGVFGWLALRIQVTNTQFSELQATHAALNRLPGVLQAGLFDQENFSAGRSTHVISARLWLSDSNDATDQTVVRQAVAVILEKYPKSRAEDGIGNELTRGFDIGIASLWRKNAEFRSITEWQRMLVDLGNIARSAAFSSMSLMEDSAP